VTGPAQVIDLVRAAHPAVAVLAIDPERAALAKDRKSEVRLWSSGTENGPRLQRRLT
jgi:hypothetical protein